MINSFFGNQRAIHRTVNIDMALHHGKYPPMKIRPATENDAPAIAAIWNHYIENTTTTFNPTPKTTTDIIDAIKTRTYLVCDTGTIQGFGTYGPFRAGAGYVHTAEHSIWFHADAMGAGFGRKLLTALESDAKSANIHTFIGGISADNTNSIAFHAACGYEKSAHLPRVGYKFGQWHDLVFMSKSL
jgi:phosphinothricin acetyltransferase